MLCYFCLFFVEIIKHVKYINATKKCSDIEHTESTILKTTLDKGINESNKLRLEKCPISPLKVTVEEEWIWSDVVDKLDDLYDQKPCKILVDPLLTKDQRETYFGDWLHFEARKHNIKRSKEEDLYIKELNNLSQRISDAGWNTTYTVYGFFEQQKPLHIRIVWFKPPDVEDCE